MKYSGIIIYNLDTKKFQFVRNSNANIVKIVNLEWNNELRVKTVRLNVDSKPLKGKLFSRIKAPSAEKFTNNLVENLNFDLKELSRKCGRDLDRAYESLVTLKDVDMSYDVDMSVDYDFEDFDMDETWMKHR